MHLDVIDLRDFYATELGGLVARQVGGALAHLVPPGGRGCVVGIGFATPYLEPYRDGSERLLALMPAAQGVLDWPRQGRSATALVDEDALPLPDSCVDLAIVVHGLEMSARPPAMMTELRRVLAGGGHMALVVPNRQGPWARSDISPFGFGRPFSRGQLRALMAQTGFVAERFETALYMPPSSRRIALRSSGVLEKYGRRMWPAFGGVTLALASKGAIERAKAAVRPGLARALEPALRPRPAGFDAGRNLL